MEKFIQVSATPILFLSWLKVKLDNDWNSTQGFVTDEGKFLDRQDARQHFVDCGQVSVSGRLHPTDLFSEDLY